MKLALLSLIICINTVLPSIITGSLIKTPHDFVAVENISVNNTITAYDQQKLSTTKITHITTTITDTLIVITTHKGCIYVSPDQQFFDAILQQWIAAKNITTQTTFLDAQLEHCACLNVEKIHLPAIKTYRITTDYPHNFFISEQELLVHNAFPVVIGLAWLFGEGLKFAGLTIGTAVFGSYIGMQLYNRQKQKEQNCNVSLHVIPCGNPCPDPDDENNKRKFNTITKTEFFETIEDHYEYYKDNVYKRKKGTKGIENAEYLKWDKLHNDVEAYAKSRWHMGSIDPKTLKIYKGPKHAKLKI